MFGAGALYARVSIPSIQGARQKPSRLVNRLNHGGERFNPHEPCRPLFLSDVSVLPLTCKPSYALRFCLHMLACSARDCCTERNNGSASHGLSPLLIASTTTCRCNYPIPRHRSAPCPAATSFIASPRRCLSGSPAASLRLLL
jgi:hypothetical protein